MDQAVAGAQLGRTIEVLEGLLGLIERPVGRRRLGQKQRVIRVKLDAFLQCFECALVLFERQVGTPGLQQEPSVVRPALKQGLELAQRLLVVPDRRERLDVPEVGVEAELEARDVDVRPGVLALRRLSGRESPFGKHRVGLFTTTLRRQRTGQPIVAGGVLGGHADRPPEVLLGGRRIVDLQSPLSAPPVGSRVARFQLDRAVDRLHRGGAVAERVPHVRHVIQPARVVGLDRQRLLVGGP